jgi:hypothetical protein
VLTLVQDETSGAHLTLFGQLDKGVSGGDAVTCVQGPETGSGNGNRGYAPKKSPNDRPDERREISWEKILF